jgi:hypothetical protein
VKKEENKRKKKGWDERMESRRKERTKEHGENPRGSKDEVKNAGTCGRSKECEEGTRKDKDK